MGGAAGQRRPPNRQFRGRIPDDQFDVTADADWYVLWDPKRRQAPGLDDRYEKVWEYSYERQVLWWDRARGPGERKYELYRRKVGKAQTEP